jgi:hypothetical protein
MYGSTTTGVPHPNPSPEGEGLFCVTLAPCKPLLFRGGVGVEHIAAKKATIA